MTYLVPTREELLLLGQQRHRAELPGTDAFLWPNTEYVFIKAVSGLVHMNFEYLAWILKQRFATTADSDMLDEHGRPINLPRNPASAAHGKVHLVGTALTTILAGTAFQRSDGARFLLIDDVTLPTDGAATVEVEAADTGAAGNTPAGAELIPQGVTALTATVHADGLGAGADREKDEYYRARILFRLRNPPRGGSEPDYIDWVGRIPGVTRIWVQKRGYGHGTVGIWFMADTPTGDGIPSQVLVDDVVAYLETVSPATARPIVKAPLAAALDVRMTGITPSTQLQARIEAEVRDVFRRRVSVAIAQTTFKNALIENAVERLVDDDLAMPFPGDTQIPRGYIPTLKSIGYL